MRRLAPYALLLFTCTWKVDPDKGRYSCTTDKDCGGGYLCITQTATGKGLCFKDGACTPEQCNGKDDNCDGRVDEGVTATACNTGLAGACSAGLSACVDGGTVCVGNYTPVAETCNGIDDDCMNGVDDGFSFSSDPLNCGRCNNRCFTGSVCANSACHETNCSDGLDNDDGGDPDCDDSDCLTVTCGDGGFNCGFLVVPFDAGTADAGDLDAGMNDAGEDAGIDDGGMDAGLDAGAPDAGPADAGSTTVPACVPRETVCDDAIDQDLDGRTDCADSDCDTRSCGTGNKKCMNGMCQ